MVAPPNGCHSGLCKKTNPFTTAGKTPDKPWLVSEVINVYEAKKLSTQCEKITSIIDI